MKKAEFKEKQMNLPFSTEDIIPFIFSKKKEVKQVDCIDKKIRYIPSDKFGIIKKKDEQIVIEWDDRNFDTILDNEFDREILKKCEIVKEMDVENLYDFDISSYPILVNNIIMYNEVEPKKIILTKSTATNLVNKLNIFLRNCND